MSSKSAHTIVISLGLFAFWVVLSGKFDAVHLAMGAFSAVGASLLSADLLYTRTRSGEKRWLSFLPWFRIARYVPWLALEIVKANIQVLKLVLGPLHRLQPEIVAIKPSLDSEVAEVALGNSITLTPGTVTLVIEEDGTYLVHAIDRSSALGLKSLDMPRRVAWAFDGADKP